MNFHRDSSDLVSQMRSWQPPLELVKSRGPVSAKQAANAADHGRKAALGGTMVGSSEAEGGAEAVSHLVGDFHDRFWLSRDASGDAAAASSAALTALSADASKRSAAAHLYAVRTTQRLIKQVMLVVRHRLTGDDRRIASSPEFEAELESAVGAAVDAELCGIFDEMSAVHELQCSQHAVIPRARPAAAAAEGGPAAQSPSRGSHPPYCGTSRPPSLATSTTSTPANRRRHASSRQAADAQLAASAPHELTEVAARRQRGAEIHALRQQIGALQQRLQDALREQQATCGGED